MPEKTMEEKLLEAIKKGQKKVSEGASKAAGAGAVFGMIQKKQIIDKAQK